MNWLERTIAVVSPRTAYRRAAYREGLRMFGGGYAGAARDRHTSDWRASTASADTLVGGDLVTLRARSEQMYRDNPYAFAALRNLKVNLVGDGIEGRALHPVAEVADLATNVFREWAAGPVDGRNNFYTVQDLSTLTFLKSGDGVHMWRDHKGQPDARVEVLDGAFIDHTRTQRHSDKMRTVLGVEFTNRERSGYWLYDDHPGDGLTGSLATSKRIDARYVDQVFDPQWGGQIRGVPALTAGMRKARDNDDLEVALRIKRKVEACLVVFEQMGAGDGDDAPPIGEQKTGAGGLAEETMRPGMIYRGRQGSTITAVNPSAAGDGSAFHRQELMSISAAWGVPYYVITGDVSQANYTSQRADMVKYWALLDSILAHAIYPFICDPAPRRRMVVEALRRNEPRLLQCTWQWTPAPREWVDPLKDITAEIMGIRAGLDNIPRALASRGINWRDHYSEQRDVNALNDKLGLAFDTDARRINGAGALQAPAGYVVPKGEQSRSRAGDFLMRMADGMARGDASILHRGALEVAAAYRDKDPLADVLAQILATLTED